MQGECTTQPDAANFPSMNGLPLVPTTSGQCLLLSNNYLLGMVPVSFWADNLYLRSAVPQEDDKQNPFSILARVVSIVPSSTASVFLTNLIFQGDGEGSTIGIDARENVFVSGSHQTCGMFWCILQAAENPNLFSQLLHFPWCMMVYMLGFGFCCCSNSYCTRKRLFELLALPRRAKQHQSSRCKAARSCSCTCRCPL
jgi:hypothetical protein